MKKQNKNLEYYLNLPYKIEIEPILEEEGGGFFARLPQFGEMGITGDGETVNEALEMLEAFKEICFQRFLDEKKEIPEPEQAKQLDDFSGRLLLRMPKELHQTIAVKANDNNVSQNQYINFLLTKAVSSVKEKNEIKKDNAIEANTPSRFKVRGDSKSQEYPFQGNNYPEEYKAAS